MKTKLISEIVDFIENGERLDYLTILKAAVSLDIDEALIAVYLPEKIESIIDFYIESTMKNIDNIAAKDLTSFSGKLIFMINNFYRDLNTKPRFFKEILRHQIKHPIKSVPRLWKICDHFIKNANDKSIDFSFYTKRAKLFQILLLVVIDILRNKSPEDIESLIEYRINLAKNSKIKNIVNFWKSKIYQ